jgi:hypothetical protein
MPRQSRFGIRPLAALSAGAILVALTGCMAAPLGQMAYQAVTAPSGPCALPTCSSSSGSALDGVTGILAGK